MEPSLPESEQRSVEPDQVCPSTVPVGPPQRQPQPKSTLWQDLQQGWDYIYFIWRVSRRIRGLRNQIRFMIGIILWKPMLPRENLDSSGLK